MRTVLACAGVNFVKRLTTLKSALAPALGSFCSINISPSTVRWRHNQPQALDRQSDRTTKAA
eukprot:638171-Hanusia_phi.AAC.1